MVERDVISKEDINIVPLGDLHIGSQQCNISKIKSVVDSILNTENKYCVLLGDLCDTGLKNSKTLVYEEIVPVSEQLIIVEKLLRPLVEKGKILAMVSGNHENRVLKEVGIDFSKVIAKDLGIEDLYRKEIAFLKLRINPKQGYHYPVYSFAITHGNGGGNVAFINKNQQFGTMIDGIDCLVTAHTHKPVVTVPSKLVVNIQTGTVSTSPFYCVTSSSFLEYGGYAIEKMFAPNSIKPQVITCACDKKHMSVTL